MVQIVFCAAPFIHSFVSTTGKKFLCCGATRWSNETRDLDDWEGKDYQYVRNHMLTSDEWLPDCRDCELQEKFNPDQSLRTQMNRIWNEHGKPTLNIDTGNVFGVPFSYDLRLNNLCNLSCRMCSPESSSQLVKEAEKHPALWPNWSQRDDTFKVSLGAKNIDWILKECNFIKNLSLLGGEPTVQPEVKQLLVKLIECKNISVKIHMTTNGTNVNSEFFDLLKQFKNVSIKVSIDSHPDKLEYIRGGANGKKIWENIKKISELSWAGNIDLSTTQVVMPYNLFDFWELGKLVRESSWIKEHQTWLVYTPHMYSPMYVPKKWKDLAAKIAKENNCYDEEKHVFDGIMIEDENLIYMQDLKRFTELTDFSRNKYLKDYHPICYEMFEEIT